MRWTNPTQLSLSLGFLSIYFRCLYIYLFIVIPPSFHSAISEEGKAFLEVLFLRHRTKKGNKRKQQHKTKRDYSLALKNFSLAAFSKWKLLDRKARGGRAKHNRIFIGVCFIAETLMLQFMLLWHVSRGKNVWPTGFVALRRHLNVWMKFLKA